MMPAGPFEVIPAVDVSGGRLARFDRGGPVPDPAHGGDPLAAASAAIEAGARWIHVVDMDLAFEGAPRNVEVVRAIASLGIRVQASGGIRSPSAVDAMLDAGAARVVLGSGALADEATTSTLLADAARPLIVGVEVEADRIRSRGASPVDLPLSATLGWLVAAGAGAFLVTAVDRVGTLAGPDTGLVRRVVRAGPPVVAAGGVRTIDDLRALRQAGASGAVVGRAALDGGLPLAAAIADG
jgi:phosphoribosylformimino-5-aminoimidazole carboxamide ribonucleotide (ProFAR) isomerase